MADPAGHAVAPPEEDAPRPVFAGDFGQLVVSVVNDGPVVVCFDTWLPDPAAPRPPFGLGFCRSRGLNLVTVRSRRNDWYQNGDMDRILDLIDAACGPRRRFGYGSSMGAYAVLNFSSRLGLDRALLFSPQYSIDPAKVPFETRWAVEAAAIGFRQDGVGESRPVTDGFLVYDPRSAPDAEHARLILRRHPLRPVPVPFGAHAVIEYFGAAGVLGRVVEEVLAGRCGQAELIALRRQLRRPSAIYWTQLSGACFRRARFEAAHRLAEAASGLARADAVLLDHIRAASLYGMGEAERALALWRRHLPDGPQARRVARLIRTAALLHGWQDLLARVRGHRPF